MSQTFSLVCKEARLRLWIGQGHGEMTTLYVGTEEAREKLKRFLQATRGKPLALLCDDTDGALLEDCGEFEDPTDGPMEDWSR